MNVRCANCGETFDSENIEQHLKDCEQGNKK